MLFSVWFFYLPCDFFVLLYESLFIACETISYVVLYLFTVHIRCTEKLGFYTLCSACLQYLEGPETQRTNFFALVHEHTLTLKTPIPRSYKSKEENRTFLVMIPIFVLPSPFDLFHFPVSVWITKKKATKENLVISGLHTSNVRCNVHFWLLFLIFYPCARVCVCVASSHQVHACH